ncbi:MAG: glycosyltransferase, partial [Nocardioides sp.]
LIEIKQEQLSAIVDAYRALGGGFLLTSSGIEATEAFYLTPQGETVEVLPQAPIPRQPTLTIETADPYVDERVLNPIGFLVDVEGPVVDLASLDLRRGATPAMVGALRSAVGVRVDTWDDAVERTVRGLACAGVPVVADSAPDSLGADVVAAILAPVDLADPLAREEHSLMLRRAALETWSSLAWRRKLGRRAGVPVAVQPSVSVVLATKRADMIDHALAQVARQRDVAELELVLAPHGFDVPADQVQSAVGEGVTVQVVPQADDAMFGDVLNAAALASGGDVVLKMDDDDWYAPDAIADLLRARAYSGAELVGMPPEFHYLTEQDLTVTRGHPSELYASFVAGGTMLVDRAMLREVGGFRAVRKFVDAQLLEGVLAAGGAIYRTHGLGYVLRRNPTGHTWQADLEFLLDPARVRSTTPGFHPSRLLT